MIFTGGVVPALWRPIVGIDAFDLREDEIDITPWLPLLCDGRIHDFEIRIAGLKDDGNGHAILSSINGSYWLVTGKVFIWLDDEKHRTTGTSPQVNSPSPELEVSSTVFKTKNGTNDTLLYKVTAERRLTITSLVQTSYGPKVASWHQELKFSNRGNFSSGGEVETNTQKTWGYDISSGGYMRQFTYPLHAYSIYGSKGDNITIRGTVHRGKDVKIVGQSAFPTGLEPFSAIDALQARPPKYQGCWFSTTQSGDATYLSNQTDQTSCGYGTTEQELSFRGIAVEFSSYAESFPPISVSDELFYRHIYATNNTIVVDEEKLEGETFAQVLPEKHDESEELPTSDLQGQGELQALRWAA